MNQSQSNDSAIYAFVFGIVGLLLGWIPFIGWLFAPLWILAIIFGLIGRKRDKNKKMAITGLILGVVITLYKIGFWFAIMFRILLEMVITLKIDWDTVLPNIEKIISMFFILVALQMLREYHFNKHPFIAGILNVRNLERPNKKAIFALVFGFLGLFLGWIPFVGWLFAPFWIMAILFGYYGSKREKHKAAALIGLYLGVITLIYKLCYWGVIALGAFFS